MTLRPAPYLVNYYTLIAETRHGRQGLETRWCPVTGRAPATTLCNLNCNIHRST